VFVGSKDEKCSDAMTIVWTFSICKWKVTPRSEPNPRLV
jgi:hypothetical protein